MGPQRAGTSWLDLYMRSRGDVCMPEDVKEIFYFDQLYTRDLDFYAGHFDPAPGQKMIMEISTTAFDTPVAPANVYNTFGQELTLICPLRNPVYRSYSLYRHYLRYGLVRGSLREAVEQIPQIVTSSRYAEHYMRWCDQFPDLSIPIVLQEDMEAELWAYVQQVCESLKLSYMPPDEHISTPYNVANNPRSSLVVCMAQHSADALRRRRFYKVINMAKKAGLKSLIFGRESGNQPTNRMADSDYAYLHDQLYGEIKAFESVIGSRIPQWHVESHETVA
jgi:hypothetical protein